MTGVARKYVVDGSLLEGGGQILRNSMSLSALLNRSLAVDNIRLGRKPPGLKNQHRTGLELVAEMSSGQLEGASIGSTQIDFMPAINWQRSNLPNSWIADAKTADPQPSCLTLRGGTNAASAPQIDYTTNVFLPFVQKHFNSPPVDVRLNKRGYYPRGGGEAIFSVPIPLTSGKSLTNTTLLEQGHIVSVEGIAHWAGLPNVIGREMVQGAKDALEVAGLGGADPDSSVPISISATRLAPSEAPGAGSGIVLHATLSNGGVIGGSALGSKGRPAIEVGKAAAEELIKNVKNGGCVDEWLQDQIVIFMALAAGKSEVNIGKDELTLHTQSAILVAEQLTDTKFSTRKDEQGNNILSCEGIGYTS